MPEPSLNPAFTLCGALALELSVAATDVRGLPRERAGVLAQEMARDLAGFDAGVTRLSMSTVGAHYDPIELLRPGWPVFTELDQLSARAPGQEQTRVLAYGAHAGRLPGNLTPDDAHLGGPLRVLPFVLRGDAETVTSVRACLERDLIEHGMAGAQTALLAQEAFAVRIEHARYLTLHDLCALTALQYEHAGLGALWPLIETALFSPGREVWLDAPPEPLLVWRAGEVHIAGFSDDQWRQQYAAELPTAGAQRLRGQFQARQRQFVSVLAAHAIAVRSVPADHLRRRLE